MVCPPAETEDVNLRVAAALRDLPRLERRLVDLCYYQEKTLTQAAKELGIGRPWASRVHARALATLGAAIGSNYSHPYRREAHETASTRRADFGGLRPSS
jgi:RNA polymerase sigma factor for flagellar operon FliA